MFLKHTVATALLGLATCFATPLIHAANISWSGAGDGTTWSDGANWAGGVAPTDNDWSDSAILGPDATAATLTNATGASVFAIDFQSAGWTVDMTFAKLTRITMLGTGANAGTNTITRPFEIKETATWMIGAGNTLFHSFPGSEQGPYSVYLSAARTLTLDGGGTVHLTKRFGGWGAAGVNLRDITLTVDDTTLYSSGMDKLTITFFDLSSTLFFKGALSDIQRWIDNSYLRADAALAGYDLIASDSGNGYTRVGFAVPEPATTALLLAATLGLGAMLLRRRRAVPAR